MQAEVMDCTRIPSWEKLHMEYGIGGQTIKQLKSLYLSHAYNRTLPELQRTSPKSDQNLSNNSVL